jgi:steroid delta-isomerase-like uncharacterized protein
MATEQNKIIARRYIEEVWSDGNIEAANAIINENFLFHGPIREVEGIEAFKQFVTAIHSTFPDINFIIEDLAAEEDKVAFRWIMTGTHNNEFMGIAATGKQFTVRGATFARLSNEKMSEAWLYWDRLGMVEQLGAALAQQ